MSVVIGVDELHRLVQTALANNGYSLEHANALAEVIVGSERDGAVSHGLHRLDQCISDVACGWVDGKAVPVVQDVASGVVAVDARNGYCQLAFKRACDLFVGKVLRHGTATLAIRNSHHLAPLWPEVEDLAERGLIALSFRSGRRTVLPWDGRQAMFGTNPMAFACPREGAPPLVWDLASSFMARGDIQIAAQRGEPVPAGAGIDGEGRPTTDPNAILKGGAQLPFGGYKGSLISFMVEVLAAAATGSLLAVEDRSTEVKGAQSANGGSLILGINPALTAGDGFAARIALLVKELDGNGAARVPGERRHARRRAAVAEGVRVDEAALERLRAWAGSAR
ncbi:MAG: Ldh family oxidoreductase [Rhodospirillales bacterium]|nr:Ldh family oxidoreductase [Rhodospirillales bacterium]